VRLGLQLLIRGPGYKDGILVPIPQYPLYRYKNQHVVLVFLSIIQSDFIAFHLCIKWRRQITVIASHHIRRCGLVCVPSLRYISASIALLGGVMIPYELNEDDDWGLCQASVQRAIEKARRESVRKRLLFTTDHLSKYCVCTEFA